MRGYGLGGKNKLNSSGGELYFDNKASPGVVVKSVKSKSTVLTQSCREGIKLEAANCRKNVSGIYLFLRLQVIVATRFLQACIFLH